jgi:hypothetical protein
MRLRATLAILTAAGFLALPIPSAAAGEPGIAILNTEPLSVSGEKGSETVDAKLSVMNISGRTVRPAATFQASSDERVNVRAVSPKRLRPGEARILTVTLGPVEGLSEAVTGQVVIDDGRSRVAQSVEVDPPAPDEPWPAVLVVGSLVLAAIAAQRVGKRFSGTQLDMPAPDPKWSFSSWGSTLTAVGAGFGVVLGAATYPPFPEHVSKEELVNLNILFGLILLAGPFLFEGRRRFVPARDGKKPKRVGSKGSLLIASSFTLWAVTGEIGALGLLAWELLGVVSGVIAGLAAVCFIVLAIKYFVSSTKEYIETDWEKEAEEAEVATVTARSLQPPARSWSLL